MARPGADIRRLDPHVTYGPVKRSPSARRAK